MAEVAAIKPGRSHWMHHPAARSAVLGLLALSLISAALLGFELLSEDVAFDFSQIVYVIVPAGAGLVVMGAAMTQDGRSKVAWLTVGAGVLAWGIGEIIWVYYEAILEVEVPYPGWADVFYVLGYPLVFVGMLLLPHVKPRRLERIRLLMDALAGSVAVGAIMWVAYLGDQIYLDPELGFLEQFVNIMYPLGDVFLLVGLMILAVRRSSLRFDARLLALAASMIITFVADYIYLIQVEADTYMSGGWLDSLWLLDNAAIIVAGWYLLRGVKTTELVDRSTRIWQLAAPYGAIMLLFGLTLLDIGGDASILQIASGVVGLLIIGRQGVAIRENRELVEKQRDDLIASISHELRTPLTSVQGFAQLLKERGEELGSEKRVELTEIIDRQSRHLGGIVTDLIDVTRNRLANTDLEVDTMDLGETITDAANMLPESTETKVDFNAESGIHILGDRRRVTQVLVNLLTNASRYGQGRVEVEAYANHGHVTIEVHDNGSGVPKRYQEVIWERFERGAHRLDATIPGSGIGLPIARSLVEAHRGTIAYRTSDRLGGACFVVSIPRLTSTVEKVVDPVSSPA
ncbi:MAG: HAMP domain-containing histidine kinase [Acidimicrobiia bacterium]|nr:HAMP domain-containing histidine kinase [Acidimicrobiia bacterium]MDH3398031.1 HAMP domain-containing histidine kinase [Acidimicrobiia bacterium]